MTNNNVLWSIGFLLIRAMGLGYYRWNFRKTIDAKRRAKLQAVPKRPLGL
jgi:hypothetical protein